MEEALNTGNGPNKELLSLFGLSVKDASRRIGLSRTSIEEGVTAGASGRPTFNQDDVVKLRLDERLFDDRSDAHEAPVIEHMRIRYGQEVADEVRMAFDRMKVPCVPDSFTELWLLIPDFDYLLKKNWAGFIKELVEVPVPITLYVGGPIEKEKLEAFLGASTLAAKKASLFLRQDTAVFSCPTVLIGDPRGVASMFFRGSSRFVSVPHDTGHGIVALLEERARDQDDD